MQMLKQAFTLWKSERHHKGTTLQHRLILFFISLAAFLIFAFALLLMLFGINGKDEKALRTYFDNELAHISGAVYDDSGRLSVDGISMAETLAASCDSFFVGHGITAEELPANPDLIEPLLSGQMQTLLASMNSRSCGGVFLLLDATVRPDAENAENSRAGIFLKKTQPTSTQSVGVKNHYLRGPAQAARDHGVELLGQWSMEFDISEEDFFRDVMDTARQNKDLSLSRLYYWTDRVTLKDNSEAGFLLCVPLRSRDGTVFGVCGIEVSDRMFKQLYCPSDSTYENVFTIAAPADGNLLRAAKGMIAGNYYLTSNRIAEDLTCTDVKNGLTQLAGKDGVYSGGMTYLRLYPSGSPYAEETWAVAVAMPDFLLDAAVRGNSLYLIIIILFLLLLSLGISVVISQRYLQPVNHALDSIRSNTYVQGGSEYLEISDLFDFLAEKDQAHEAQREALEQEKQDAAAIADSAQLELSRVVDRKRKEVDPDAYQLFRQNLVKLTPKEREVFDLYLAGKTAKEIVVILDFSPNALKFHNKNIYDKLGVSSRKELLLYAALMKQEGIKPI